MICKNCGNKLDESYAFCDKCGAPVNATINSEPQTPVNPVPPVSQQPTSQQPTSQQPAPQQPAPQQPAPQQPVTQQSAPQQPVYQQAPPIYQNPPYNYQNVNPVYNQPDMSPTTTIGQYIGWLLIGSIPIIGWILVIIFAIDSSNKNRANFFRAQIVMILIFVGVFLLFGSVILSALSDLMWSL